MHKKINNQECLYPLPYKILNWLIYILKTQINVYTHLVYCKLTIGLDNSRYVSV